MGGLRAGQYEAVLGGSFVVLSAVVVGSAVVYWNARTLAELEGERLKIHAGPRDTRLVLHEKIKEIFTPAPSIRLKNTRTVTTGLKVAVGVMTVSLDGEKEPVQTVMELVPARTTKSGKRNASWTPTSVRT